MKGSLAKATEPKMANLHVQLLFDRVEVIMKNDNMSELLCSKA